uniref:Natriuretic peptide A n=1 Tax=Hucho hucho TaxID=62062 RepID=A0A4W5K1X9_9TELE
MARKATSWGLLVLLCQQTLMAVHVLGRPYPASNLNLLERFEETLAAVDYESPNPEPEHSQASFCSQTSGRQLWKGATAAQSQRSRLQDLVMATRSKAVTGCFGARMDRIRNSSGLGCRPERGSYCSTVS